MSEAADQFEAPIVVCDANILYSIVMTDLILSLGSAELFHLRWTDQIHEEWMRNLLADRPDLDPAKIGRRRRQMNSAIEDCLIEGYEHLVPSLTLPDQDDRHVLAAAIHGIAQVILTFNWFNVKTGLQDASRVRSDDALKVHCFGKLTVGYLVLVFNP